MASTSSDVVDELAAANRAVAQQDAPHAKVTSDSLRNYAFPIADFAKARANARGIKVPQVIAHRGFQAKFPENSLLAFQEAVKAGATGLETDVRLTKDNVVVLNHDPHLKRFGNDKKLIDYTWDEIKEMRSTAAPHVPMIRLQDLLEHLVEAYDERTWILLDVKPNEEPEPLMRLTAAAIAGVRVPPGQKPWNERIVLGLWAARQLALAASFLPGFPALHIGFNYPYARRHFSDARLGCLFAVESLLGFGGGAFIRDRQTRLAPTMAWTVNERDQAEWCARRGLDGIVTDNPELMSQVWEQFNPAKVPWMPLTLYAYGRALYIYFLVHFRFAWFMKVLKLDEPPVPRALAEDKKSQ